MASIFEIEERAKRQWDRRTALVTFVLSPTPPTVLTILIAICGAWAAFILWVAMSLIQFFTS